MMMKTRLSLFGLLCTLHVSGALQVLLVCSSSNLTALQVNDSHGGTFFYSGEGLVAAGCFTPEENTLFGEVTIWVSWNDSTIAQSALDSLTGCFELQFSLEEAGNQTLSLTAVERDSGSNATTHCNGSISLPVEVHACVLHSLPVSPRQLYLSNAVDSLCLQDTYTGTLLHGISGEGMVVETPGYGGALLTTFDEVSPEDSSEISSAWSFQQESCWLQLQGRKGFEKSTHELDLGDHLELETMSLLTDMGERTLGDSLQFLPEHLWDVSVQFTNPELFDYYTAVTHQWNQTVLTVHVWLRTLTAATSSVMFQSVYCPQHCEDCTLTVTISSGCPENKHLSFSYPEDRHLFKLPVNYRPPSWLGTAIPTSPHIYNADPNQPLMNTHYDISKATAAFKQCQGKTTRMECNCTRDLETSTDIGSSDCTTKVYHHPYDSPFPLKFAIHLGDGVQSPVTHSIAMEELNNRTDLSIKGQVDDRVIAPGKRAEVIFHGPGLYHFKTTINTNSTFCQFTTQFAVYVDRVPLLKATEYSLATSTVVLFGILTFFINFYYHRYHRGH